MKLEHCAFNFAGPLPCKVDTKLIKISFMGEGVLVRPVAIHLWVHIPLPDISLWGLNILLVCTWVFSSHSPKMC